MPVCCSHGRILGCHVNGMFPYVLLVKHMHASFRSTLCAKGQLLLMQAVKPVLGKYYRTPAKSPGPIPTHLLEPLVRSFRNDHYVEDSGDIVFYKRDPSFGAARPAAAK